jgi:hypothetical protein
LTRNRSPDPATAPVTRAAGQLTRRPLPRIIATFGSIVKYAALAPLLFVASAVLGAGLKGPVTVRVAWTNCAEAQCSGCRIQIITIDDGSYYIAVHERVGVKIYTKVSGRRVGVKIEVSLTDEHRRSDGAFVDGNGASAIIGSGESKELEAGILKALVSLPDATRDYPGPTPGPSSS